VASPFPIKGASVEVLFGILVGGFCQLFLYLKGWAIADKTNSLNSRVMEYFFIFFCERAFAMVGHLKNVRPEQMHNKNTKSEIKILMLNGIFSARTEAK